MSVLAASLSLRTRLLLACVLVQVMMLALLIVNGISIMDAKLAERTRIHLEEEKQLLSAALVMPLASGQYQALSEILGRVRRDDGIVYLVVLDRGGKVVASAGRDGAALIKKLPPPPEPSHVEHLRQTRECACDE